MEKPRLSARPISQDIPGEVDPSVMATGRGMSPFRDGLAATNPTAAILT